VIFNWVQRRRAARRRSAERGEGTVRRLMSRASRSGTFDTAARKTIEKRHGERMRLDGHLRGEVMVFQPMTVLDISPAGVQIQTAVALQFGSEHDFRISLDYRAVIVRGRVVYCHISELTDASASYQSGVAFVDLSSSAASVIGDFVSTIQSARSETFESAKG
jgi:hypothetical protein